MSRPNITPGVWVDYRGSRPLSVRGRVGQGTRTGSSGDVHTHFPGPPFYKGKVKFKSWYNSPVGRQWRNICRINARNKAYRIVKTMEKEELIAGMDDPLVRLAFEKVVEIVVDQVAKENPRAQAAGYEGKAVYEYSAKDRLSAIDKLLAYRIAKPESKSKVTVATAEDWLASLDRE